MFGSVKHVINYVERLSSFRVFLSEVLLQANVQVQLLLSQYCHNYLYAIGIISPCRPINNTMLKIAILNIVGVATPDQGGRGERGERERSFNRRERRGHQHLCSQRERERGRFAHYLSFDGCGYARLPLAYKIHRRFHCIIPYDPQAHACSMYSYVIVLMLAACVRDSTIIIASQLTFIIIIIWLIASQLASIHKN